VRFRGADLGSLLEAVNAKGYGLTMGIHSRIEETVDFVRQRACAGNLYVNRNMIGATVGVQPFGGEGSREPAEGRRPALPLPLRQRAHLHRSTPRPRAETPPSSPPSE
jgi:RHH-type proline utilization regulon transcriptional repressor/proline dehydrogenase/delta 1-pyrroline-5-carboxylate dehydrogenase